MRLAIEEIRHADEGRRERVVSIAGVCGSTKQALKEASLARDCGYDIALVSLGALPTASENQLISHCREIAATIPLFGFYLQPAVGGRVLPYAFWRRFAEIENVMAVKIAPFNRYQTIDVVRAIAESGRDNIALYTGNDDNIILDLLAPYTFRVNGKAAKRRIVGGLLGQWAVWTRKAVRCLEECHRIAGEGGPIPERLLRRNVELTDANAAIFDAAIGFAGCIPGIHEVLRRQGLLAGTWCLDPQELLSKGQSEQISRVAEAYPHLNDDEFVGEHLDKWMR